MLGLSSLYTLSALINFWHPKTQDLDYIVVLGAGLLGDKVTPLLAHRIQKGIKIHQQNPHSQLIMSGGQGADELIPEAEAMANYALAQGLGPSQVMTESRSVSTYENLLFSSQLMAPDAKFAVVTNYYHLFRALLIAEELGLDCYGYGAPTKLYFSLNAFIREFIGYLYLQRKLHASIALVIILVSLLLFTLS